MLVPGITLFFLGLVLGLIGFGFSAKNMSKQMANPLSLLAQDNNSFFKKHLMTMFPMALGSVLSLVGIVLIIIHYLEK